MQNMMKTTDVLATCPPGRNLAMVYETSDQNA
jgi:hypothetical protein